MKPLPFVAQSHAVEIAGLWIAPQGEKRRADYLLSGFAAAQTILAVGGSLGRGLSLKRKPGWELLRSEVKAREGPYP